MGTKLGLRVESDDDNSTTDYGKMRLRPSKKHIMIVEKLKSQTAVGLICAFEEPNINEGLQKFSLACPSLRKIESNHWDQLRKFCSDS